MIHLFLNCDEYLASLELQKLKAALGDPEFAGLNFAELAGDKVTASDIVAEASALPFLSERRMVVVTGYLTALGRRMKQSKKPDSPAFVEYASVLGLGEDPRILGFADIPDSTDLVLVDSGIDKDNPIIAGVKSDEGKKSPGLTDRAKKLGWKNYNLNAPRKDGEIIAWIVDQARKRGFRIEPAAATRMARTVGPELRQLQSELEKLSLYAGKRVITEADVRIMVSDTREETIWGLTDGLSQRDRKKAFLSLAELQRDDQNMIGILSAIASNFRTIIRVKEMAQEGVRSVEEMAKRLGVKGSTFPIEKAMGVMGNFTFAQLDVVMFRLLEANLAMVTGADQATEMDLLVSDLTTRRN
jgi:DNA polymerase-3 subunit delta